MCAFKVIKELKSVKGIIMLERCSSNGCRYSTAWPPFLSCMQVIPLWRNLAPLMCFLTLDFQLVYLEVKSYLTIITLAFHKFIKSQISSCIAIVHSTCTYYTRVYLFIDWSIALECLTLWLGVAVVDFDNTDRAWQDYDSSKPLIHRYPSKFQ